jgi:RNA polymerase sigma-70 factor (ECF subfamily)
VADGGTLAERVAGADQAPVMDEDAFRTFYDLTARSVWGYLVSLTGDPHAADDLLQESYYRLLRVRREWESELHQRNYLYRIATNLARDRYRRAAGRETVRFDEHDCPDLGTGVDEAARADQRTDLHGALARLSPREQEMLWLAYAEGASHAEIAGTLGLGTRGVRVTLFRARRKLASMLRGAAAVRRRPT